jgi:hypothetical protein
MIGLKRGAIAFHDETPFRLGQTRWPGPRSSAATPLGGLYLQIVFLL